MTSTEWRPRDLKNSLKKSRLIKKPEPCHGTRPLPSHGTSAARAGIASRRSQPLDLCQPQQKQNRHRGRFSASPSLPQPRLPLAPLPTAPLAGLEDVAKGREAQPRLRYAPATPLCCCRVAGSQKDAEQPSGCSNLQSGTRLTHCCSRTVGTESYLEVISRHPCF